MRRRSGVVKIRLAAADQPTKIAIRAGNEPHGPPKATARCRGVELGLILSYFAICKSLATKTGIHPVAYVERARKTRFFLGSDL